jgi:hypothetical protein
MRGLGLGGMGLGVLLVPRTADMRPIVIDPFVERHHPANGADRHVILPQETPPAEAPRIGMALVQMLCAVSALQRRVTS